jgi:HPt (histidine-containing phosphotransfer) domain-containing protein
MPTSNSSALTELQKIFSKEDMLEILEFALPRITEKGDELQQLLAASAWEPAARIAHQMLSSASTYASKNFDNMLRHIAQQDLDVINCALFQQALKLELSGIIHDIQEWIVNNKIQ